MVRFGVEVIWLKQLSIYGFTTLWSPTVFFLVATAAAVYLLILGPSARNRLGPTATGWQTMWFMTGLLCAWLGLGTPVHIVGEVYLMTAHMISTMLLTMVVPPLLILGMPTWALERVLCHRFVQPVFRVFTRPLVAFGVLNFVFALWHLPPMFDAALQSDSLHLVQYATLFLSGLVGWWPILSPVPALPRLSDPMQMIYSFGCIVLQTFLYGWIMILEEPLYQAYRFAPRLIEGLSPLVDQQIGHMFMGVLSPLILGTVFTIAFFRMANQEKPGQHNPTIRNQHATSLE
jgi:putative membrane protein